MQAFLYIKAVLMISTFQLSLRIYNFSLCVCVCFIVQSCPDNLQLHGLYVLGSSVHGISQIRILEWVAISFSRGSFEPASPALAGGFFTAQPPGKPGIAHRLEKAGLGMWVWLPSPGLVSAFEQ